MRKVLILNQFYFRNNSIDGAVYKVSYEMLFRNISFFLKPLRFIHELLGLPFFQIWYIKNWEQIFKGYDLIILHDSPQKHANYFIKKITEFSDKGTKLKLYYWNQVYDLDRLQLNDRWEVLSFDYKDAVENNMRYVGGFFLPDPVRKLIPSIDLFFVGTDKGRFKFLREFEKDLNKQKIKTLFILVSIKRKVSKVYSRAIPYNEVLENVLRSKGIVDITKEGQVGLTLRAYEALFYDKFLVSNNSYLKNYDFFEPEKIYILEKNKEDAQHIAEFLNNTPAVYSKEIKQRYSFEAWLERIDHNIELDNVHL